MLEDPAIGGFTVRTAINGKSYELSEEIEAFYADQPRDSLLLAYFSCHGLKDEDGRLYFAASNTKLARLAATGLSAQFVHEQMDRCRSRRLVLLLDCCYSGAFSRLSTKADRRVDVMERLSGRGRVIITASTAMEYAFVGEQAEQAEMGTSVFTRALVHGLATGQADLDGDGRVSVDDLYDYVHDQVLSVTPNQTPSMQADVEGTIYLARSPEVVRVGSLVLPPLDPPSSPDTDQTSTTGRHRWYRHLRRRRVQVTSALLVLSLTALALIVVKPWSNAPMWAELPSMSEALEAAAVAEYDGRLWVAGGVSADKGRAKLANVNVYDPGTQTWREGPSLPQGISHAALVSTGQQLFLLGGLTVAGSAATVYRLDSPTARWIEDAPLPAARGAGAAAFDGSRIVFGGGVGTDGRAKADVWAFQDGQWRTMNELSRPREKLAAATDDNGTVWFFAGRDPNTQQTAFAEVDVVQSNSVKPAGTLVAVAGPAAVWWPDLGPCVVGGQTEAGFSSEIVCRSDNLPGPPPELTSARAGLGAAVIGQSVYVVGGYDAGHHGSSTVEVFDGAAAR